MIMTMEKCFALYFPLKGKVVCSQGNAKKLSAAVALALLAFDAQLFFIFDSKTSSVGKKQCVTVGVPKDYKRTVLIELTPSYIPSFRYQSCLLLIV